MLAQPVRAGASPFEIRERSRRATLLVQRSTTEAGTRPCSHAPQLSRAHAACSDHTRYGDRYNNHRVRHFVRSIRSTGIVQPWRVIDRPDIPRERQRPLKRLARPAHHSEE